MSNNPLGGVMVKILTQDLQVKPAIQMAPAKSYVCVSCGAEIDGYMELEGIGNDDKVIEIFTRLFNIVWRDDDDETQSKPLLDEAKGELNNHMWKINAMFDSLEVGAEWRFQISEEIDLMVIRVM